MRTSANAVVPAGVTPFTEQLPTLTSPGLGIIDATAGTIANPATATIEMVNANTHKFHTNLAATQTFAYRTVSIGGVPLLGAQDYLGPVIVAKQGAPLNLTVVNSLGAHPLAAAIDDALVPAGSIDATNPRASTHLHGGNTDTDNDGGPMDTFAPGSQFTYNYLNTQEAAGLWYHDHAVGITRLNVYAGLAGGYLIRNADDPGDGSRLPAPPYEVPLIIQDRMFNPTDGTFLYPANANLSTPRAWAPEFFGDIATVNGKIWPNLNVDRGKYRFRVYNGSNARFYNLKLKSSLGTVLTFFQIGSDGGLLNAPVPLTKLLLGPGERADLVVDFAALPTGTTVRLTNDARVPFPGGPRAAKRGGMPLPEIMQFTVTGAGGWTAPLPVPLRATPIAPLATLARPVAATRSMTLVEILDPFGAPLMALLNNRAFDTTARTQVTGGTLEQWDLINTTGDAHPIHLHFTQFQVLNRQKFDVAGYMAASGYPVPLAEDLGPYPPPTVTPFLKGKATAAPANEQGWKDTVIAMPGEVTRIVVPFGANAAGSVTAFQTSYTGEYVWHCHILEHEDNDMMQSYVITPPPP
jgi:FtsP/CotA-like multicopper oxidase with cupredoxin domain